VRLPFIVCLCGGKRANPCSFGVRVSWDQAGRLATLVFGAPPHPQVPGMFTAEERDAISAEVREWAAARGLDAGRDGCWAAFIGRVRDNLHVVLAMSPVGDAFRARCVSKAGPLPAPARPSDAGVLGNRPVCFWMCGPLHSLAWPLAPSGAVSSRRSSTARRSTGSTPGRPRPCGRWRASSSTAQTSGAPRWDGGGAFSAAA
jgi:hypothetical protein